ncbi:MAG: hypothetical protein M1477_04995 [Candidatus Thermoplasmatota archaeon]|nr:hypothetical protein [Candidatus Thermoplasmatota archaeon]
MKDVSKLYSRKCRVLVRERSTDSVFESLSSYKRLTVCGPSLPPKVDSHEWKFESIKSRRIRSGVKTELVTVSAELDRQRKEWNLGNKA